MIKSPSIDKNAFRDMLELMRKKAWLETKEEEIMYLWELCDSTEQRELLKELMLEIYVLGNVEEEQAAIAINDYIHSIPLLPQNTWIVSVADVGKLDGSLSGMQILRQKIKPTLDWQPRYISHIPEVATKLQDGDNIILFDDFLGSGDKFLKKLKWLQDTANKVPNLNVASLSIHFISFAGMKFGISRLGSKKHNVFVFKELHKGISERNDSDDTKKKLATMLQLESRLSPSCNNRALSDYSFGYKKSESLYYWRNNSCPNNVFPIFWWEKLCFDKEHEPLITRAD